VSLRNFAVLPDAPRWTSAARGVYASVRKRRPLSSAALVIHAVSIALLLGLGSAFWAVSGDYPFGRVRAGAWQAAPRVGSREADPYARAVLARNAEIPLAIGEGLTLTATEDDAGRPLDAKCAYQIGRVAPQARFWTMTAYDAEGRPMSSELQRSGFTSAEVLRDREGGFSIVISREPMPGNWLRTPEAGRVGLALRLYDTPVATGSATLDARALPGVERLDCQP
jgi:hypothetical protein